MKKELKNKALTDGELENVNGGGTKLLFYCGGITGRAKEDEVWEILDPINGQRLQGFTSKAAAEASVGKDLCIEVNWDQVQKARGLI